MPHWKLILRCYVLQCKKLRSSEYMLNLEVMCPVDVIMFCFLWLPEHQILTDPATWRMQDYFHFCLEWNSWLWMFTADRILQGLKVASMWTLRKANPGVMFSFLCFFVSLSLVDLCRIFSVLSAILYLGNVTYRRKSTGRDEGLDLGPPEVLSTLSDLLKVGCSLNPTVLLREFRKRVCSVVFWLLA